MSNIGAEGPTGIEIDHCVIHVGDWEVARDFYTRVMGGEPIEVNGGYVFRFGDRQLNCHGPNKFAEPKALDPVRPGNSDLCFVWPGPIAAAIAHLEEQGVDVEMVPVTRFGGRGEGTSVYFRDPDGSLMEFMSYDS
ncbi:MAG: VOC family protein [Pseudomonadota bacterium]